MSSSLQEFAHLQIPLEDVASATNNFADENLIGQGGSAKVYKGKLLWSGQFNDVAVRRLDREHGQGDTEFWMEISMLSRLKHENLVSIVGFCDEDGEKIIINKHEANESLDKYLSDPTLTWMQRLHICVDVAHVLSYIHYDKRRNYGVIHRNIKSSKILLNENWEAKVCGFGLSIANLSTRRHRFVLSHPVGTFGYADPAYTKTGSVTHKSDVYSFGVVLFEVLCGRKAIIIDDGAHQYLAPMARQHYEERKLDEIIDPDLRKQMDPQSLTIFSDTAYHCLKEQRTQRPDMEKVVQSLEQALEFQGKHENPLILKECSTVALEDTSSNHHQWEKLEHLKIPLNDIKLATNGFAETCLIGGGGYGAVYKAELDHFDSRNSLSIEGKKIHELPKTVAIKRILSRTGRIGEQGFFAEIEVLSRCEHPNIISLLGFCVEDSEMILVYEYASNGSLDDYLQRNRNMINLTWVQRIKMCLDIAKGLKYLHTSMEHKQRILHRDIKSANILLGNNWEAKIADFGLSRSYPANPQASTLNTNILVGTKMYYDPEYEKTGKMKKESDIYSFGVVLFEILSGKLAYDSNYVAKNGKGLAHVARRCFRERTLKEIVDSNLKEETDENIFTLNRGLNQDSLDTFLKIAYQCVAKTQAERPTIEVVIEELEKALYLQENRKDILKFSLQDIELATENFSINNLIGRGGFGNVYKGEVPHANGRTTIAAKRLDRDLGQGEHEFLTELEILFEYKHENVIGLVGYCDEMDEKIIVYEHASNGSLDRCLNDVSLTWMKRLKICIDVASGLDFLHGGVVTQEIVIHRDVKSANILLNGDWKAKISDFGLSLISPINQEMKFVIDKAAGTMGYIDPLSLSHGILAKESDIYTFGVVLLEILCGRRQSCENNDGERSGIVIDLVKSGYEEGKLDEMVFEGIKEQIVPKSLTTFQAIAIQCLHDEIEKRPTTGEVVAQLKKALEFQEDYEIWEPKLPRDYKEIIQMSKSPEIYSSKNRKYLYDMLSKGILLQEGKVWFSLGSNGERNEMISARKFSYINRCPHKWRSVPESRFQKVVEKLDISNLKIRIKQRTQFLSPDVVYGVHLVFKFCDSRKFSSKPMYVNLKYRTGSETLHAYFATWRDNEWMMIELCRFLNHKEDIVFKFLLESFSRYYCGDGAIYVEGIEFRPIDNVKHEEIEKLKEVQQVLISNSNMDQVQQLPTNCEDIFKRTDNNDEGQKLFSLSEVNGKKHLMLSAKAALYDYSNVKLFNSKPSAQSRFQEVIELLPQQEFRINCMIKSQMLSRDTKYVCYLVFKLSEKCHELDYPVKVLHLLHRKNKEVEILYFRSPSPWNLHDINRVPKQREDGWMEVDVWKFNSNHELKNDCLHVDLKLISYEGTMSGLIVCGFEFRPI